MDYHKDRFHDFSLMAYEDDKLVALLPLNRVDGQERVTSHAGLTYGGFVVPRGVRALKTIEYLYHTLKYLFEQGITELYYKQLPSFYNEIPSEEIDYAMFLLEAELYRVDIASTINLRHKLKYQERRNRSIKKALGNNIEVKGDNDFAEFWTSILTPNLLSRFGVLPVHSLEEISFLAANNPEIRQYNAYLDGKILAGTTIFETSTTAHAQYISASEEGRANGALDFLFDKLITEYYSHKDFFDFGIVNEDQGKKVNGGLLDWKEGFGGRSYAHRFFKVNTANCHMLKSALPV
ncbi:MAG: hypothetical protein K0S09_3166 [Sphingobacteriaceae bacterium]|jgi:hypothetical protein|nr:hypothetical protein [Sphingobacteriaceae bacterium]